MSLSESELAQRAKKLRLVLSDVDGVLTDAGVFYSERGEELKRFSVRDGMGVERLRGLGVETGFLTRESSGPVARRAEKLRIVHCYLGVWDKERELERILEEAGLSLDELAYIGDDVNDLGIMASIGRAGLIGAPADAMPEVKRVAHHVCAAKGGQGAFRDFAEWLIELRGGAR